MSKQQFGGKRLGSGASVYQNEVKFGRSTFNRNKVVRTSMSPGTLVPLYTEIGVTGDTIDIDLESIVKTLPTIGPLFGSFKFQVDAFQVPMRLFNNLLHMNKNDIGLRMKEVYIPQMELTYLQPHMKTINRGLFEPSSIMSYLGIRGGGLSKQHPTANTARKQRMALGLLSYWSIYKQFYANKQEKKGYYIRPNVRNGWTVTSVEIKFSNSGIGSSDVLAGGVLEDPIGFPSMPTNEIWQVIVFSLNGYGSPNMDITFMFSNGQQVIAAGALGRVEAGNGFLRIYNEYGSNFSGYTMYGVSNQTSATISEPIDISEFDLSNIDDIQLQILQHSINSPFVLDETSLSPYGDALGSVEEGRGRIPNNCYSQNGLGIKTYQSDVFNGWLHTETIAGANAINDVTSVDVSDGKLDINNLIFSKKLFNMLNRISSAGGTFEDWNDSVYGVQTARRAETPMFVGGMSREIIFSEVISSVKESEDNPLGTLAGKGEQSHDKKGGRINIKCTEPCIIMIIGSLTPRVDYSQGERWYNTLKTIDDLHKPDMDGIGFQSLLTTEMLCTDCIQDEVTGVTETKSAGFMPAWIHYTTDINETFGEFAKEDSQMFMTLNRRYESSATGKLMDLTTYIDPTKFNHIFADAQLDAQNFWVQLGIRAEYRRIMSSKLIPYA